MAKLIDITGKPLSGEWGTDDEIGKGIPVLRTTNFTNIGVIDYRNVVTRSIIKKNLDEKFLRDGDIIIEKSGGSDKFPVGRVVYFDGEEKRFLFNNFTGVLRVKDKDVWYPRYVFYALYENYRRGGTRPFENKTTGLHNLKIDDYVSRYEVKHNTYNKQVLICNYLDILFGIMKKREKQLEKMDKLIKARFVEMFGDPVSNNKKWIMNTFGEICRVRQGLQIPISKRLINYEEGCYEYITVQYINGGKDREYIKNPKPTVICMEDDILMARTGNTGKVITGVRGVFHNNFFKIEFDRKKYNNAFIVQYLNLDFIKADIIRRAGVSTIPDLNHGEFYKIKIFEPPIELQNKFATFVSQVNKSKLLAVSQPQIHIYKTLTLL